MQLIGTITTTGQKLTGTITANNSTIVGTINDNSQNIIGTVQEVGARGYSAYQLAQLNGYSGTVTEWLLSLAPSGPNTPSVDGVELNVDGNLVISLTDGSSVSTVAQLDSSTIVDEKIDAAISGIVAEAPTIIKVGYFPSYYEIPVEAIGNILDFDDAYGSEVLLDNSFGVEGDTITVVSSNFTKRIFYTYNGIPYNDIVALPTPIGYSPALRDGNSLVTLYKSASGWIMSGDLQGTGYGIKTVSAVGGDWIYSYMLLENGTTVIVPTGGDVILFLNEYVPTESIVLEYRIMNNLPGAVFGIEELYWANTNLLIPPGYLAKPRAIGSVISITYVGNNKWLLGGDLELATPTESPGLTALYLDAVGNGYTNTFSAWLESRLIMNIDVSASDAGKFLSTDGINTQWENISKESVGLSLVDNTSDVNKPVSLAQGIELDKKLNITDFDSTLIVSAATIDQGSL